MKNNDIHSLSHTKWNCKYHIVFAPKYRRKVFYGEKRAEIGKILSNKGLTTDEVQKKIKDIVNEAANAANILEQSGYSVFKRNLEDAMYNMNNLSTYMLGPSNELYIIFAYGNKNFTSEMDIVLYE